MHFSIAFCRLNGTRRLHPVSVCECIYDWNILFGMSVCLRTALSKSKTHKKAPNAYFACIDLSVVCKLHAISVCSVLICPIVIASFDMQPCTHFRDANLTTGNMHPHFKKRNASNFYHFLFFALWVWWVYDWADFWSSFFASFSCNFLGLLKHNESRVARHKISFSMWFIWIHSVSAH